MHIEVDHRQSDRSPAIGAQVGKARKLAKRIWHMKNPHDCARRVLHGVTDELKSAVTALLGKKGVVW